MEVHFREFLILGTRIQFSVEFHAPAALTPVITGKGVVWAIGSVRTCQEIKKNLATAKNRTAVVQPLANYFTEKSRLIIINWDQENSAEIY